MCCELCGCGATVFLMRTSRSAGSDRFIHLEASFFAELEAS